MERKDRRSMLRRSLSADVGPTNVRTQLKRRISFSEKNSVRVFSREEEPKAWNNSYEISDNLNANENTSILSVPYKTKNVESCKKVALENDENFDPAGLSEDLQMHLHQEPNQTNYFTSSNTSVLSSTKDFINACYANQSGKMYQIENSLDITLHENEKCFRMEKHKRTKEANTHLYSFSLDDHETEAWSLTLGEKTADFMPHIRSELNAQVDNTDTLDFSSKQLGNVFIENKNQVVFRDLSCNMINSTAIRKSCNRETTGVNLNENEIDAMDTSTVLKVSSNANPFSMRIPNETLNNSCLMEIEEETVSYSQINEKIGKSLQSIQNVKSKSDGLPINRSIEADNLQSDSMCSNVNQFNDVEVQTINKSNNHCSIYNSKSRQTINLNQSLETSPLKYKISVGRKTLNMNEDMDVSPFKLSEKFDSCKMINNSPGICKHESQSKPLVRKISVPFVNKNQTPCKEKAENNVPLYLVEDYATTPAEMVKSIKDNESLSFSLDSLKNVTLSSSKFASPLIPLEFKGYNLKQLNDEIEHGNIQVFPGGNSASCLHRSKIVSKRSLVFEDMPSYRVDTPRKSLEIDKANIVLHSNTSLDCVPKGKTNNSEYSFGDADATTRDNTTLLAIMDLSNEIVPSKSSRTDINQMKNDLHIFEESVSSKTKENVLPSDSVFEKSRSKESDVPISMDVSMHIEKNVGLSFISHQPLQPQTEEHTERKEERFNEVIVDDSDLSEGNVESFAVQKKSFAKISKPNVPKHETDTGISDTKTIRRTIYFEEEISSEQHQLDKTDEEIIEVDNCNVNCGNSYSSRRTLYFGSDISLENTCTELPEKTDKEYTDRESNVSIPTEKYDNVILNSIRGKKISNFNNECPKQNISMEIFESTHVENKFVDIKQVEPQSRVRGTIYINQDIALESESSAIAEKSFQNEKCHTTQNSNPLKKSLCSEDKICDYETTIEAIRATTVQLTNQKEHFAVCNSNNKKHAAHIFRADSKRKSVYTPENMELTLGEGETGNCEMENSKEKNLGNNFLSSVYIMDSTSDNVKPEENIYMSTISDVSACFGDERHNSKSDVRQTETKLALHEPNSSTSDAMEKARNITPFINLTLEDLDEIRLSLVQSNCEDDNRNVDGGKQGECLQTGIREKVDTNPTAKEKRQEQRCQEATLLHEIADSCSSFVIPELRTPDLGLDRLRRLRKRPGIADIRIYTLPIIPIHTNSFIDDNSNHETECKNSFVTQFLKKYESDMLNFEISLLGNQHCAYSEKFVSFVSRLDDLLRKNNTNWIFDYQMESRGIFRFIHRKLVTFALSLTFEETDFLGHEITPKHIRIEKSHFRRKNWKPIDFCLDFQLGCLLPFNIVCNGSNEFSIFKMLQDIDQMCLETLKMFNDFLLICYTNEANILRSGGNIYLRKIVRKIVTDTNAGFKYVEKTEIKIELMSLKKLSFKDVVSPPLHHFREEIHLLPTGLQFLKEFLPDPLRYVKNC